MKKYLFLFILLGFLAPSLAAQEFTEGPFTFSVLFNSGYETPSVNVWISGEIEGSDVVFPATVSPEHTDTIYTVKEITHKGGDVHYDNIKIPETVVSVSDVFIFRNRPLKAFEVSEANSALKSVDGCLYSKDGTILFACPSDLDVVEIAEGTTTLGAYSISDNKAKEIRLPNTIQTIQSLAMSGCPNITEIALPESLTEITSDAFCGCVNLSTVYIPDRMALLDNFAMFKGCPITNFMLSSANENYSEFLGGLYSKDFSKLISFPSTRETVAIHTDTRIIGSYAFSESNASEIALSDNVSEIGGAAFENSKCETILLSDKIVEIPGSAFSDCRNLKNFVIPASVERIGGYAFSECVSLKSLVVPETVKRISLLSFLGTEERSDCKVVVLNPDIELGLDIFPSELKCPTIYAAGNTFGRLEAAFPANSGFLKKLPDYFVFYNEWIMGLGPNSSYSITFGIYDFAGSTNGLQFDVTLPEGVSIVSMSFSDDSDSCSSEWVKLSNGDYRLLSYKTDGSAFDEPCSFDFHVESNESLKRSDILFHNIVASIDGIKYPIKDETMHITGYDINVPEVLEIEEGDSLDLPHPLTGDFEGITYSYGSSDTTVATIENNNTLHALRPGVFQISVNVVDPNYNVPGNFRDITVTPALWGDADRSKAIDLADVVAVVNHILEREVENFSAKLADVNRDGSIDVADLTSIVKLVLAQPVPDEGEGDVTAAPGLRELSFGEAQLGADGKRHISLEIETSSDYTAMQTDIELPEGYIVEAVSLGSELGKHALDYAAVAPQTTRLILYSASLAELPAGRNAAVVDLTLSGAGEGSIRASRALACDADGRSYTLAATEAPLNVTTGVSSAESAGMSAMTVAGGMEITAPEGTAVTVSDIAGRVLLSFTAEGAPAFRPFVPGVYVVAFEASAATAKVLVK